ncbi:hypothetical protein E6O75_ATG00033 [Venturia nashicola]|uniref:DUF6594 domain-containing protein n=1 Tax=Venturia nashicola TaxID=86259 RepID=A0A4Z1PFA7_9PEZI|nr:hypothetical protein E6O75_ATG00033 [Venturia nashicola]
MSLNYDQKVPSSPSLPTSSSPSSPSLPASPTSPIPGLTFASEYDPEAGKLQKKPTFHERFSFGSKLRDAPPNTTVEEFREQARLATDEIAETDTRTLEGSPNGYPRVSTFLASEPNFSLYRGFHTLHSRVLLELQDDIAALERELDEVDRVDDETEAGKKRLANRQFDLKRSRGEDGFRPRREILAELRTKLLEYDELLIKARDIQGFQKPSHRDYKSVRTWFWNLKPLVSKEAGFIKKKEDIITLRSGREWSSFDGLVESTLRRFDCGLVRVGHSTNVPPTKVREHLSRSLISRQRIFCTRELREKTHDQNMYYYSASRVESFVGLIITSIIFVLLVLPVIVMYKLTSYGQGEHGTFRAIGVLVVFTLLFSAAMSMLTKARRHELFAAAAAYCAVLVVFISNFSGGS